MYIRSDLEEAIKKGFGIEKFSYIGMGKNDVSNRDLLVFNTNKETIAIEIGFYEFYDMYEVKVIPEYPDRFRRVDSEINCIYTFEESTHLVTSKATISFPGKAFNFTEALVLLTLEET